jgi:hypothetical protein
MIRDEMRIVSALVACLHNAYVRLRLLEEEHIAGKRILRLYYDALQIVIANGGSGGSKGLHGEGIGSDFFFSTIY